MPAWLGAAAVPARLVAADLSWAYGAPRLAAELYQSVARDGPARAQHWAGRAALILLDLDGVDAAVAVTDEFGDLPADPLFQAVVAVVRDNWTQLRETLTAWSPVTPLERFLRFLLLQREVMTGRGSEVIERSTLDEVITAGTEELDAGDLPGVALSVARYLILRANTPAVVRDLVAWRCGTWDGHRVIVVGCVDFR